MLTRIRRSLERIRYYSASRRPTGWTRIQDALFLASLPAALPAVLVSEALVRQPVPVVSLHGALAGSAPGPLAAALSDDPGSLAWPGPVPYGEFELSLDDVRRGWPITTAIERRPVRLDLNVYANEQRQRGVTLPAAAPERVAIEAALAGGGHDEVLAAWRDGTAPASRRAWFGSLYGVLLWWVILLLGSLLLAGTLRYAVLVAFVRRADVATERRRRGRCGTCDYDLRGHAFTDRCPECGSLVK